ncbi:hypothetical protein [Faunimonas pinastri]|uniref:hypothetical protein n=1 Tax=Faunimonas pinastri TaxID=1855383 RepID=UPI00115FB16E|nr:hypothetical protein [Faunimonas pinastri]
MQKIKATGQRGSWFARADGEKLPCVHKHWWRGGRYHDPFARPGEKKWDELIDAIRTGKRVILTDDDVSADSSEFRRKGYIAVFAVSDVHVDETGLHFSMDARLKELK